ncbi:serpentine type 7TM GPCR chemoreceptor srbc domain-containing protein [Ditylenchus destructor]|uniref:Serpentine type 7TM GPCR chemoreceptor srbc domain-containing protein n=1 Tax=Ditylenchus destructor TaxID=166010 RepID=A0AAD4MJ64_9BILA|nr:serpentine type 7TM GPCR chemoreceptor srbc domain-containing protein [Ditylenchus destructor]
MNHVLYLYFWKRKSLKVKRLSPTLIVFLGSRMAFTVMVLPYHIYILLLFKFQAEAFNYNPYALLWSNVVLTNYLQITAVSAFFLVIDRCLAIKAPLSYNVWISRLCSVLILVVILIFCSISVIFAWLEIPLDFEQVQNCESSQCVAIKYKSSATNFMKSVVGVTTLLIGIYFLNILRSVNHDRLNNRIVKVTMIMEALLDTLPIIFCYGFTAVSRTQYCALNFFYSNVFPCNCTPLLIPEIIPLGYQLDLV